MVGLGSGEPACAKETHASMHPVRWPRINAGYERQHSRAETWRILYLHYVLPFRGRRPTAAVRKSWLSLVSPATTQHGSLSQAPLPSLSIVPGTMGVSGAPASARGRTTTRDPLSVMARRQRQVQSAFAPLAFPDRPAAHANGVMRHFPLLSPGCVLGATPRVGRHATPVDTVSRCEISCLSLTRGQKSYNRGWRMHRDMPTDAQRC